MWILGSTAVVILLAVCLTEGAAVPASAVEPPVPSTTGARVPAVQGKAASPAPEAPWSVVFHDGSGNGLRLWKASKRASVRFEFTPVQPENSSTGLYSGGKPSKGRVDTRRVRELWRWVRKLEGDPSLRAETRDKGTGAFGVKSASGGDREFLIEDCPLLREFTGWLRAEVVGAESYNPTMRKPGR